MAGSKSDFLEKELLDHVLGNAAYSAPATVHLALYTVAPSDLGGGTEVVGGGYGRKSVANNATNWPAATGVTATKNNGVAQTFTTATASWGTVVYLQTGGGQ
jgi:beta-glucosidase-like glycosyl hydrolase